MHLPAGVSTTGASFAGASPEGAFTAGGSSDATGAVSTAGVSPAAALPDAVEAVGPVIAVGVGASARSGASLEEPQPMITG